jgi:hypothetical protein
VISKKIIKASPKKSKTIREYPIPQIVKDVRTFLGLASYYRRLVPKFAEIAKQSKNSCHKNSARNLPIEHGCRVVAANII